MKNADKPINPMNASFSGVDNELKIEYQNDNFSQQMGGLTKREYFAGLAMQALISNPNIKRPNPDNEKDKKDFSEVAIEYADSLLKQLESTEIN